MTLAGRLDGRWHTGVWKEPSMDTCPHCSAPLRPNRIGAVGSRGEGQPLPQGAPGFTCDACDARFLQGDDGGLVEIKKPS